MTPTLTAEGITAAERWTFPGLPEDASRARHLTRMVLAEWGLGHLSADAETVVSELVANACTHGAPPVTVVLRAAGDTLAVHVSDTGPMRPPHEHGDETGRGLPMVAALASTVAAGCSEHGKTVTATFAARPMVVAA